MVLCADGTFYTGWTFDLAARVSAHNEGRGARYTSGRRPVELAFCEQVRSRSEALRREHAIKKMSGRNKRRLAENFSARPGRSELPWPEREERKESPGNT
jgi:putative endonuclease